MTPKIDLAEIKKQAKHIRRYFEQEMGVQDPELRYPYKLSLPACKQVATALEALPKLVNVLGTLQDAIDYMELERSQSLVIGEPEKEIIKQALTLFGTTKTTGQ